MRINNSGRIGVANTTPQSMLHLGNCEVFGSAPVKIMDQVLEMFLWVIVNRFIF